MATGRGESEGIRRTGGGGRCFSGIPSTCVGKPETRMAITCQATTMLEIMTLAPFAFKTPSTPVAVMMLERLPRASKWPSASAGHVGQARGLRCCAQHDKGMLRLCMSCAEKTAQPPALTVDERMFLFGGAPREVLEVFVIWFCVAAALAATGHDAFIVFVQEGRSRVVNTRENLTQSI